LYKDGAVLKALAAGLTFKIVESRQFWKERLSARDENNAVVWEADITWDQLKGMGYLVVIQPESATPTPQPTPGGA
jgi:hypothetical protein